MVGAYVSPLVLCRCWRRDRFAAARPARATWSREARSTAHAVARSLELDDVSSPRPGPLKLPDSALEPIDWNALEGWAADDHAAAFATFLVSCRPMLRTIPPQGETRPMYFARQRALAAGRLADEVLDRIEAQQPHTELIELSVSAGASD